MKKISKEMERQILKRAIADCVEEAKQVKDYEELMELHGYAVVDTEDHFLYRADSGRYISDKSLGDYYRRSNVLKHIYNNRNGG